MLQSLTLTRPSLFPSPFSHRVPCHLAPQRTNSNAAFRARAGDPRKRKGIEGRSKGEGGGSLDEGHCETAVGRQVGRQH